MDWIKYFRRGDMSLGDALFFYLEESGAPPDLMEAYATALTSYQDGEVSDLAEPFGVAMTQRQKNAMKKRIRDRQIFDTVESCATGWSRAIVRDRAIVKEEVDDPLPKSLPELGETAFCRAGELLGMSAETLKREYYRIRKEREK